MSDLVFVAGPYGSDPEIKQLRATLIAQTCIALMQKGIITISPLIYGLGLIEHAGSELEDIYDVWNTFCETFVGVTKKFYVVDMIGWQTSNGLRAEMLKAYELGIPIFLIDPKTLEEKEDLGPVAKVLSNINQ